MADEVLTVLPEAVLTGVPEAHNDLTQGALK
jgi:hypothetical protein